ncbi:pantoate--beta-alanine ligase [Ereboglobus sp. PH5-5]|uniref:pantoate--beta-alanine ligase n=1 Tax=unclassified Ereboglobus TaxID=2626932 RepID=UPI00240497C3|nr:MULTISPECIES: pantoate--beta-alanine ligase [unclassified Ereboglobus]MDF9828235.1 pantoate--beta-alanine ligase [Ereboglobus sp. PH5-10]MDF9832395.1 pantoate--beta-alanine ligase [Ereboglobus sp. PH5-5]
MQTITTVSEMQAYANDLCARGKTIGLVPTMGALHEGHLSLIRLAAEKADVVIVSVFVNPTQFGPSEDFNKYPRDLGHDLELCEKTGAHVVFAPANEEMYPKGYSTYVNEERVAKPLEGISRPTHFRGVTTVVAKLFNIVRPTFAIFGQKDAQQAAVLMKMTADLNFQVEILMAPTVREEGGLAMSSRNRYLTNTQRQEALAINEALSHAKTMVEKGERRVDRLVAEVTHMIGEKRRLRVIYAAIVDRRTMEPAREVVPGEALMVIAVWVDEVRLIDNMIL